MMLMVAAEALFFFLLASFQGNLHAHSWAVRRHPCAGTESAQGRGRSYTPTRDSARRDACQRKDTAGEGGRVGRGGRAGSPILSGGEETPALPAEFKPVVSSRSLHPFCCATRNTISTATHSLPPSPPPARDRRISRLPCRAQPKEG